MAFARGFNQPAGAQLHSRARHSSRVTGGLGGVSKQQLRMKKPPAEGGITGIRKAHLACNRKSQKTHIGPDSFRAGFSFPTKTPKTLGRGRCLFPRWSPSGSRSRLCGGTQKETPTPAFLAGWRDGGLRWQQEIVRWSPRLDARLYRPTKMNSDPRTEAGAHSDTTKETHLSNGSSMPSGQSPHWKKFFKTVETSIGRTPGTESANTSWEAWEKSQASLKPARP